MTTAEMRQTSQQIEAAMLIVIEAEDVIATCGGDMKAAVIELVRLIYDQEAMIDGLRQSASSGFRRRHPDTVD